MAAKPGKVGVYIPAELAEAWEAWEERTGQKINLSGEVQGVIRRLIGEPSPEDVLSDRLAAVIKRLDVQDRKVRALEKTVKELQRGK